MTIKTFAATGVVMAAMVVTSGTALACDTAPKPVVQHQNSNTNCNHVVKPTPAPKTDCNHPVVTPTPTPSTTPKPTAAPKPGCDHKVTPTPTPTPGKGSTPQTPAPTPVTTPAPVAQPTTLPQTGGTGDLSALLGLPTLAVTGSAYLRSRKAK